MKFKYLVPNFFTVASLVCGLFALNFIYEEHFIFACWLLTISMLCDAMDGKLARYLNASSTFGAELDTLSDFFAFGIVPAFLAYKYSLQTFDMIGVVISVLYVLAGAYRLVRFNLGNSDLSTKHDFEGLPIPAAAGMLIALVIFNNAVVDQTMHYAFLFVTLLLAYLMASHIEYIAVDKGSKYANKGKYVIALMLVSFIFIFRYYYYIYIIWMGGYILLGIVRHFIRFVHKNKRLYEKQ